MRGIAGIFRGATYGGGGFAVFADFVIAQDGGGAFCEDRRMRVSGRSALSESLLIASGQMVSSGFSLWNALAKLGPSLRGVRRTGSTALDLAYIAAGRAEVALSGPVRFWMLPPVGYWCARRAG